MDPYTTLEVPHTATADDIKKAYRRLAKKWHPDKNGGSLGAAKMFRDVKAAYDCVVDPVKRAATDAQRKFQKQAEATKKAEAHRQAGARTYGQPPHGRSGMSPWAVLFALFTLVFIIVAVFGSNNGGSNSTTA